MIITRKNHMTTDIGSKAGNLFLLQRAGFQVPPFFCVGQSFREEEVLDYLGANFPDTRSFSVRSCASLEDSDGCSFAGQFKTFLRVPREEVCMRIREVLGHGEHPEKTAYFQAHGIAPDALKMHVIIQEMVEPDVSGVLFTVNPQGILNESVIVCGRGAGDQVVEDRADVTTYYYNLADKNGYYEQAGDSPLLTEGEIEELIQSSQQIRALLACGMTGESDEGFCRNTDKASDKAFCRNTDKASDKSFDRNTDKASDKAFCRNTDKASDKSFDRNTDKASDKAFCRNTDKASDKSFDSNTDVTPDKDFDIEFAIQNHHIYFLQARPVTSIDRTAPAIILDNSNIVESYPGITLPLTQSFIRDAYYQVFKSLLLHLTGEPETVEQIDGNLQHMVDMANGRVYYRISNWYDVLLLLPFSSRLIPIWQEMMGVRDKKVSSAHSAGNSGKQGRIRRKTRLKVAYSFIRFLLTCPREMEKLDLYFQEIIQRFEALETDAEDNRILLKHYHTLKEMTVKRWDITLVNDMYGFLFTGLLKSRLKARHVPDYELAANRAISGVQKLESMRPIEQLQKLAHQAGEENRLPELRAIQSNEAFFQYIGQSNHAFSRALQAYVREFGDRNVEELKLESKTFRTDPVLLIRCILQYAESLFLADSEVSGATDAETSEASVDAGHSSIEKAAPPPLTGLSAFYAKRAAVGIRNREKSRLHRGRLYGMMRALVLQMGQNLYRQGRIAEPSDIFWLYCEEIEAAESDAVLNLAGIIAGRKKEYDGYAELPAYSRLVFSGKVIDKHPRNCCKIRHDICRDDCYAADDRNRRHPPEAGLQGSESGAGNVPQRVYRGTACSPGIAEGEVLLIETPSPLLDTKGKILVTKMTDPGWVFLIAPAKAIVSEKGSLLSHTAIISRELKKPAVVGIEHITEYLKTGDRIRVDGDAGTVTVLPDCSETTER